MNDDYELINGKLCLKDGRRYRSSMRAMDAVPKTNLHDGHGGVVGHRPGYVVATNQSNVARTPR